MNGSSGISGAVSSNSAGRHAERKHVLITATLITCDGAYKAHVRDISSEGAHVVVFAPLKPNADAMLRRGTVFVAAKIVWSEGNEAGIRFYRSLSEFDVAAMFQPVALRTILP